MTPKQRVMAAMELRPVDRIPVFPVITAYLGSRVLGRKLRDMVLEPSLVFDGIREMHRRFGFDGFEVGLGPPRDAPGPRTSSQDGITYILDAAGRPTARIQADDVPIPLDTGPPIRDKRDLDEIAVTPASHYIHSGSVDPVAELVRDLGESAFVAGVAGNQTMNALVAWRGAEQALLDLTDDPPFVHDAMQRATAIAIEIGTSLVHAGVPCVYIGDAWASASILSPAMYEEFCLPYHREAARAFHKLGVKVYLHICGDSGPLLRLMAETEVDAIEPLDVDAGVRLEEAQAAVGGRVCLKGGVSTRLLLDGTPDQVYEEARRCIDILGPRGYILGSADDIPRDAPFANVEAMVQAARDSAD